VDSVESSKTDASSKRLARDPVIDGGASIMWLWSLPVIATVERLIGGAFHCFLQVDVWLGLIQNLTPMGDVVLHQMFVQWMGDSQPAVKMQRDSSMTGLRLRLLGEMMPPAVAMDLPSEVVSLPVVACFFKAMAF